MIKHNHLPLHQPILVDEADEILASTGKFRALSHSGFMDLKLVYIGIGPFNGNLPVAFNSLHQEMCQLLTRVWIVLTQPPRDICTELPQMQMHTHENDLLSFLSLMSSQWRSEIRLHCWLLPGVNANYGKALCIWVPRAKNMIWVFWQSA